ncbi:MAG: membrane protein insertase YidC [Nitrospiraceae bacterium]|nr:membrane protein insertase YidC [Nitrospiraceae bacterium]
MLKKMLPLIAIVLGFNFLLYYYFSTHQSASPPPTNGKGIISSNLISVPMINDMESSLLSLSNKDIRLSFSQTSGTMTGWKLLSYFTSDKKSNIDLLRSKPGFMGGGLVVQDKNGLLPLTLVRTAYNGAPLPSNNLVATTPSTLSLVYSFNNHPVTLSYTLAPQGYHVSVTVDNPDHLHLVFLPGLNFGMSDETQFIGTEFQGPIYGTPDGKMNEFKKDISEVFPPTSLTWVGNETKYFIGYISLKGFPASTEIIKDKTNSFLRLSFNNAHATLTLTGEPKRYSLLKSAEPGLLDTVDFGWFLFGRITLVSFLAKFLFVFLSTLYTHMQNYGFAIIFVTLLIKILFSPLAYMSFRSMNQMQQLQPEIKKLQAKFKDDKAQLNAAMMELYKERRINPLGGCLPVIVQIPVFVALYNILNNTVELRQAPFLLWIHDLSIKDPYYIFPIIMGITMVIQTKLTPSTPDPMQRRIMLFLPVVMTFFFLNFPSGLVLYWIVNNLLTIGQQYVLMRYVFKTIPAK